MATAAADTVPDPRIHVTADHLRRLGGRARAITLLPRQPAGSILNGRHASRLRGRGLNFEELRVYADGDDIRTIDWKVTARTGEPYVRVYTEERDRPTLLIVDQRQTTSSAGNSALRASLSAHAVAANLQKIDLLADGLVTLPRAVSAGLGRFFAIFGPLLHRHSSGPIQFGRRWLLWRETAAGTDTSLLLLQTAGPTIDALARTI